MNLWSKFIDKIKRIFGKNKSEIINIDIKKPEKGKLGIKPPHTPFGIPPLKNRNQNIDKNQSRTRRINRSRKNQ